MSWLTGHGDGARVERFTFQAGRSPTLTGGRRIYDYCKSLVRIPRHERARFPEDHCAQSDHDSSDRRRLTQRDRNPCGPPSRVRRYRLSHQLPCDGRLTLAHHHRHLQMPQSLDGPAPIVIGDNMEGRDPAMHLIDVLNPGSSVSSSWQRSGGAIVVSLKFEQSRF